VIDAISESLKSVQSLDYCKYVMDKIDIILLMSVNPGFGGQKFIPSTLAKAKEARKLIDESVSAHLYTRKHSSPSPPHSHF
jgi:pentose-5-phosphate-3-epimerase